MKAKAKTKKGARVGQRFDNFLKEEGMHEEVHATAIKRVIAWQLAEAMKAKHITKSEMAKRMSTSRSQLNRLLDPKIEGIELQTLVRAAHVLGRNLRVELV
jgi:DNA-binding Xre family transcriptional regulator